MKQRAQERKETSDMPNYSPEELARRRAKTKRKKDAQRDRRAGKPRRGKKPKRRRPPPPAYPNEPIIKVMGQQMTKPFFSVIAYANNSDTYRSNYDSMAATAHIPFEFIFVGPTPPSDEMPDNFRYITTDAKPAKCVEIAARSAVGEYLIVGSDNIVFSDYLIGKLFGYTLRVDPDEILLGARLMDETFHSTVPYSPNRFDESLVFDKNVSCSPVIVMAPTIKRDQWYKFGGVDKRTETSFAAELEMQMRCFESDMTPFIIPDCMIKHANCLDIQQQDLLLHREGKEARSLLNSWWVKDGTTSKTRLSPVESFTGEELKI